MVGRWCWEHYVRWLLTSDPDGEPPKFTYPPCQPGELWLLVVHYEENYLVSNRGRVWSRPRYKTPGGLMKLQKSPFGYWQVGLTATDGTQKTHWVHNLVLRAFVGPRPDGMPITRHLNGNPWDNRWPENICYGTYPENGEDMVEHGRSRNAAKTHCPQGHEYTEANTYINPASGGRTCKICAREHSRKGQKRYLERLRASGKQCSRDDCEEPLRAKGLCQRHYDQERRSAKPVAA